MKLIPKTLLIGASLLAAGAHAEGLYIGGNVGGSHYKSDALPGLTSDRSDTGYKLFGGYALSPNLAVEGGWASLGKFSGANGNLKADGLFLDGVGTLPLGNNFSALGRIGIFNGKLDSNTSGSDRGTSLKLGAGLEYAIDRNLAVRGEWERYRFDALGAKPNVDLYSVGLKYSF